MLAPETGHASSPVHWLSTVARRAGLPQADHLEVHADISMPDAWTAVSSHCGITDVHLAREVAKLYGLEVADWTNAERRAQTLIPGDLARRFTVFPLRETDRDVVVATGDPLNLDAEQAIGFASGRRPVFEIAPPSLIAQALDAVHGCDRSVETLVGRVESNMEDVVRVVAHGAPEELLEPETDQGPVVKLTNLILRDATRQGASDIHLQPGRHGGTVRFRVDGVMRQYMPLPMPALNRVVSRVKIMGSLDIADRMRPQDGRARIEIASVPYDLRISTVPTRESEKAVIRILGTQTAETLEDLHILTEERVRLGKLLANRTGILIVTGPTGSGKTTTLYAALSTLATGEVNVMTVEDPVEYELMDVTQIQVEPKRGVTFASALRAILRQDPDVIFVGEIRDGETATAAAQASQTGHFVLSTVHTNDAVGVIERLKDLGLEPAAIAGSLRGVLAQRLMRRACPDCAESVADLTAEEARLADLHGVRPMVRAVGCDACGNSGYRGRMPVVEVFAVTDQVAALIHHGASEAEVRQAAVAGGMRGLREAALERVTRGETTLVELERVMGEAVADAAPAEAGPSNPTVLAVDDDAVNRTLVRSLLSSQGFNVLEAEDGTQAMERLQRAEDIALLVLDLDMPQMDGWEVLRRVRSSVHTAGIPVIVLTGTAHQNAEAELMEQGADDYIRKPVDAPRFLARVKAVLRRAGG